MEHVKFGEHCKHRCSESVAILAQAISAIESARRVPWRGTLRWRMRSAAAWKGDREVDEMQMLVVLGVWSCRPGMFYVPCWGSGHAAPRRFAGDREVEEQKMLEAQCGCVDVASCACL